MVVLEEVTDEQGITLLKKIKDVKNEDGTLSKVEKYVDHEGKQVSKTITKQKDGREVIVE